MEDAVVMEAAAAAALPKLPELEAQNATNMLWGPAGVKLDHAHITDAASEVGLQRTAAPTPQDASNAA